MAQTSTVCQGLINLFGIESPGLTSSLAIGRYVMNMAQGM
jgi:L-2-hydroxyglutarate oxidase LhgO